MRWVPGLSPGVKGPGRDADHPPSSSAEVKEGVELYIYSPSGPSWTVLGWTSLLTKFVHCWVYGDFSPKLYNATRVSITPECILIKRKTKNKPTKCTK